jgi:hypothetical protein
MYAVRLLLVLDGDCCVGVLEQSEVKVATNSLLERLRYIIHLRNSLNKQVKMSAEKKQLLSRSSLETEIHLGMYLHMLDSSSLLHSQRKQESAYSFQRSYHFEKSCVGKQPRFFNLQFRSCVSYNPKRRKRSLIK